MGETEQVLNFTLSYITMAGYVGVGIIFLCIAYYIKGWSRVAAYVCGAAGLTLLVAYAGFDMLSRYFPHVLIARSNINGRIIKATQAETVDIAVSNPLAPGPYLRRENDPRFDDLAIYDFLAHYNGDYNCITVSVGRPAGKPEPIYYDLPIRSTDASASRELVVTLGRGADGRPVSAKMQRYEDSRPFGDPQPLTKLTLSQESCTEVDPHPHPVPANSWLHLSRSAWAMTAMERPGRRPPAVPVAGTEYRFRLSSTDPFTRRKARVDLARRGAAAIPIIEGLLNDRDYQVQLGALVALGSLPAAIRAQLSARGREKVHALQRYPDPTMQEAARNALR